MTPTIQASQGVPGIKANAMDIHFEGRAFYHDEKNNLRTYIFPILIAPADQKAALSAYQVIKTAATARPAQPAPPQVASIDIGNVIPSEGASKIRVHLSDGTIQEIDKIQEIDSLREIFHRTSPKIHLAEYDINGRGDTTGRNCLMSPTERASKVSNLSFREILSLESIKTELNKIPVNKRAPRLRKLWQVQCLRDSAKRYLSDKITAKNLELQTLSADSNLLQQTLTQEIAALEALYAQIDGWNNLALAISILFPPSDKATHAETIQQAETRLKLFQAVIKSFPNPGYWNKTKKIFGNTNSLTEDENEFCFEGALLGASNTKELIMLSQNQTFHCDVTNDPQNGEWGVLHSLSSLHENGNANSGNIPVNAANALIRHPRIQSTFTQMSKRDRDDFQTFAQTFFTQADQFPNISVTNPDFGLSVNEFSQNVNQAIAADAQNKQYPLLGNFPA